MSLQTAPGDLPSRSTAVTRASFTLAVCRLRVVHISCFLPAGLDSPCPTRVCTRRFVTLIQLHPRGSGNQAFIRPIAGAMDNRYRKDRRSAMRRRLVAYRALANRPAAAVQAQQADPKRFPNLLFLMHFFGFLSAPPRIPWTRVHLPVCPLAPQTNRSLRRGFLAVTACRNGKPKGADQASPSPKRMSP